MAAIPGTTRTSITFDRFAAAVVQQESGGNYQARSPAGALGKYQILASNIPAWSREILGYPITPQQFLESPSLQDAIGLGKLRQYYQRYGPAGAAAAWYSGDPSRADDPTPVAGGPSVRDYVRSVLRRAGANPSGPLASLPGKAARGAKNVVSGAAEAAAEPLLQAVESARKDVGRFLTTAGFVLAGLVLVTLGAYRMVQPQLRRATDRAAELGGKALKGAVA